MEFSSSPPGKKFIEFLRKLRKREIPQGIKEREMALFRLMGYPQYRAITSLSYFESWQKSKERIDENYRLLRFLKHEGNLLNDEASNSGGVNTLDTEIRTPAVKEEESMADQIPTLEKESQRQLNSLSLKHSLQELETLQSDIRDRVKQFHKKLKECEKLEKTSSKVEKQEDNIQYEEEKSTEEFKPSEMLLPEEMVQEHQAIFEELALDKKGNWDSEAKASSGVESEPEESKNKIQGNKQTEQAPVIVKQSKPRKSILKRIDESPMKAISSKNTQKKVSFKRGNATSKHKTYRQIRTAFSHVWENLKDQWFCLASGLHLVESGIT